MEQPPSESSPIESQNEVHENLIGQENSKALDPTANEISTQIEQTVDEKCEENFKIIDGTVFDKDVKTSELEAPRNAKGNSRPPNKFGSDKSYRPKTKPQTQKTSAVAKSSPNEVKKSSLVEEKSVGRNEANKPSSLPTPRKSTIPPGATTAKAIPTDKSKLKASETSSVMPYNSTNKSKIPGVNRRLSNASLSEKPKNVQSPAPRSISNFSLNKARTNTATAKTNTRNFSKASFGATASNSSKVKEEEVKSQTARSMGSRSFLNKNKRSASNSSSRSMPSFKKEESANSLRPVVSTAGDHNMIDSLERRLEKEQTEFLQKIEKFKFASPEKLKCNYKFISVVRNDKCKLMIKDDELRELPQKFPANSVCDFKKKIQKYMNDYFAAVMDTLKTENESRVENPETFQDDLKNQWILKSNDILSYIDELCVSQENTNDFQVMEIQKKLQACTEALLLSEKNIVDLSKQHDEELLLLDKHFEEQSKKNLAEKIAEIKDLHKQSKALGNENNNLKAAAKENQAFIAKLKEELKTSKDSCTIQNEKFRAAVQKLTQDKNTLSTENERIKETLEAQLKEIENLKRTLAEKPEVEANAINNCSDHLRQITELKNVIKNLEHENFNMEGQITKLEKESSSILEVRAKLKEAEVHIKELQKKLEVKEKSLEAIPKDLQVELSKIRQSLEEKNREIGNLKAHQSKYQSNLCKLEEELQRDHQLLEVRSELIKSLQTNEKSHRIQIEDLFANVGEKANTIKELNNELAMKSEEFRNVFSTLSAKQMELSNQEHIIKLLEESNERSQMLRVKQEEKISRMEEELTHLKQTIAIYQANILPGQNCKKVLFAPMLPSSTLECNENFYYYTSQRKRKRQNDIVVKKYEA